MKKIFLVLVLMMFCSVVYAENKIYFDADKNLEVVDVSGKKTLEQINVEFKGKFTDITAERKANEVAVNLVTKAIAEKENLIQAKVTELQKEEAIIELQKEGKLDDAGNVVKLK